MKKIIIAAIAKDNFNRNIIGINNTIPWKIKEDMKYFFETTKNHPLILGYTTGLSIYEGYRDKSKFLSGRTPIILSRNKTDFFGLKNVLFARNLIDALAMAQHDCLQRGVNRAFIAGGQSVYEQTIGLADELDITQVYGTFQGDSYFPEISEADWKEVARESHNEAGFCFKRYERR